jgi:hypothetical protein
VQICDYFKPKKAKMTIRFLPLLLLPLIGISQTNAQVEMPISGNTVSEKQPLEIKRNALYNLEEIKVRWKKAALENCSGVPCVVAPPAPSFACGTSTVLDFDVNAYNTVSIGNQSWTATNLKVTKYNDGSLIPDLTTSTSNPWAPTSGARTEYVAVGVAGYIGTFGYLYNWYAATDSRNICPTGWHVPTYTEWDTLTTYLGGVETVGTVMKDTSTLWNVAIRPSRGTNTSGFSALPGGYRKFDGSFIYINILAIYWSTTEHNSSLAWFRYLNENSGNVIRYYHSKSFGSSVLCLRD